MPDLTFPCPSCGEPVPPLYVNNCPSCGHQLNMAFASLKLMREHELYLVPAGPGEWYAGPWQETYTASRGYRGHLAPTPDEAILGAVEKLKEKVMSERDIAGGPKAAKRMQEARTDP